MSDVINIKIIAILFSIIIPFLINYYIISNKLFLSVPNTRDMHKESVSSSGGISIFIGFTILLFFYLNPEQVSNISIIFISTLSIFILGLLDDLYNLNKRNRFVIQYTISSFLLYYFFQLDLFSSLLYSLFFTYLINTYNFMDGIDSLAVNQYLFICIALYFHLPTDSSLFLSNPLLFLTIVIGFYFFNVSPAKIFLGNSGSYLLGFLISIFYFDSYINSYISIDVLLIIHAVFIIDTLYTLIIRFLNHLLFVTDSIKHDFIMRITKSLIYITHPHNTHAYQKICMANSSHFKTSFQILLYNLFWLLPISILCSIYIEYSFIFIFCAFLPYIILCIYFRAGRQNLD